MDLLAALRPRQWTKNLFVFAGILFSQHVTDLPMLVEVVVAFATFCMVSGAVYLVNDLRDLEQDRRHPLKRQRPLASGRLAPGTAWAAVGVLGVASAAAAWWVGLPFLALVVTYLAVQVLYTYGLKRVVILDVFCIAAGFVLRVLAGAVAIDVYVSRWLVICTLMISLFLGFAKRRHELQAVGVDTRHVLAEYSPGFLDQLISIVTAATLVSYTLYTTDPETVAKFGTRDLIYTVPFVLYGLFRYLYLIHMKSAGAEGAGGAPENTLLGDRPLLVNVALWLLVVAVVLYA